MDKIEYQAFANCSNLTKVTILSSHIEIEQGAFYKCSNLKSVEFPDSVKSGIIGTGTPFHNNAYYIGGAFEDCKSLTSIAIPKDVTNIGNSAFNSCANLASVSIPKGVTNIGTHAFSDCANLTNIIIPSTVTMIRIIVTVKVSPKKQKVKSAKPAKGKKLTVKWTKDKNASGYQVQISTSKSFKKNAKETNMKKYSKTSSTFKKLKAGKKYYVRVRSYKRTGKSALYGAWSTPKQSKKIKK